MGCLVGLAQVIRKRWIRICYLRNCVLGHGRMLPGWDAGDWEQVGAATSGTHDGSSSVLRTGRTAMKTIWAPLWRNSESEYGGTTVLVSLWGLVYYFLCNTLLFSVIQSVTLYLASILPPDLTTSKANELWWTLGYIHWSWDSLSGTSAVTANVLIRVVISKQGS